MSYLAYLARWDLEPDGDPVTTRSGKLVPVRRQGRAATPITVARVAARALAG